MKHILKRLFMLWLDADEAHLDERIAADDDAIMATWKWEKNENKQIYTNFQLSATPTQWQPCFPWIFMHMKDQKSTGEERERWADGADRDSHNYADK